MKSIKGFVGIFLIIRISYKLFKTKRNMAKRRETRNSKVDRNKDYFLKTSMIVNSLMQPRRYSFGTDLPCFIL